jgi:hypothetical protein
MYFVRLKILHFIGLFYIFLFDFVLLGFLYSILLFWALLYLSINSVNEYCVILYRLWQILFMFLLGNFCSLFLRSLILRYHLFLDSLLYRLIYYLTQYLLTSFFSRFLIFL